MDSFALIGGGKVAEQIVMRQMRVPGETPLDEVIERIRPLDVDDLTIFDADEMVIGPFDVAEALVACPRTVDGGEAEEMIVAQSGSFDVAYALIAPGTIGI